VRPPWFMPFLIRVERTIKSRARYLFTYEAGLTDGITYGPMEQMWGGGASWMRLNDGRPVRFGYGKRLADTSYGSMRRRLLGRAEKARIPCENLLMEEHGDQRSKDQEWAERKILVTAHYFEEYQRDPDAGADEGADHDRQDR